MSLVCQRCGLPEKLCVCEEIAREHCKKKTMKDIVEKIVKKKREYKDDFKYCEECGQHHYKNAHIKKGEKC